MVRLSNCGNTARNSRSRWRHSSLGDIRSSVFAVMVKCRAAYIPAPAVSRAATSTTISEWRVLTATIRSISIVPGGHEARLDKGCDIAERWLACAPDLSGLAFGGDTVNGQDQT